MPLIALARSIALPTWKRAEAKSSRSIDKAAGRDLIPDYLKAIAIIGVVCIHADVPGAALFRFCVPVCVGIWALYFERALQKAEIGQGANRAKIIRKRMILLFIPYIVWTLFYILQRYSVSEFLALPIHTILFGQFGGFGFPGQYFFIVIFQLYLIFFGLRKIVRKENFAVLIAASLIMNWVVLYLFSDWTIIAKLAYRPFFYWLPYVIMGIALARGFVRRVPPLALAIPPIIAIIPFELANASALAHYTAISVSIASLLLLSMCASPPDKRWKQKRVKNRIFSMLDKPVGYVGRNTYPIFLTNPFFLSFAGNLGDGVVAQFGAVIVALCGGLLLAETLRRLGLGIVVGERKGFQRARTG